MKLKLEGDQIQIACQELKTLYKGVWSGKNEKIPTLKFTNKKVEGTITFDDVNLDIKGTRLIKEFNRLLALVTDSEKNKLKPSDLTKSVFKNMFYTESAFNGLPYNKILLKKIETELRKFGIGEIKVKAPLTEEESFSSKNVLLGIECRPGGSYESPSSGFYSRLKTFLLKKYPMVESDKESFTLASPSFFTLLQKEKKVDLKIDETMIGTYFPERNFIHLFFNPFAFNKIGVFTKDIPLPLKELFKLFKKITIKKNDITDIQRRLLVSAFAKKSKEKEKSLKSNIKSNETRITDYGRSIRTCVENIHSDSISLEFIKSLMNSSGEKLFKEIDKIKLLPFIKNVEIGSGVINILYKATSIPIPNMKRNDSDKGVGKRYVYMGEIGFKISPGEFRVYGNCPIKGTNPHPHGGESTNGQNSSPCFGDGDGHRKIYQLLTEYKFSELAKMLWFWIKTYRNSGAYIKVWTTYDDRLKKGLPVFDEKGKRIKINDPARIKTGEQVKLKKESVYNDNIKKYKGVKL